MSEEPERSRRRLLTEPMRLRFVTLKTLPKLGLGLSLSLASVIVVGALLPVAFVDVTARLVGQVPDAITNGFDSPQGRSLLVLLAIAGGLFVAQQGIWPFSEALSETLGRRVDGYFRNMVMRGTLEPAGTAHLEDPLLLDQVSLARGVGPSRFTPGRAVSGMARVSSQYLQALFFCAALLSFHWWLAILIFVARVLLRQAARRNYLKMINVFTSQAQSLRKSDYFRDLALRPDPAKEARIFQMSDWILGRFSMHWLEVMQAAWKERKEGTMAMFPVMIGNWVLLYIAYSLLARAALAGLDLKDVALYAMAIFQTRAISWITEADVQTEYGVAAVPAALGLEASTSAARLRSGGIDPKDRPLEAVVLKDVTFRYPRAHRDVFQGLNLTIPAGKSLAIVGFNGAGKTTLVKLLCRFYDPDSGIIKVDGTDLREFQAHLWQHRVAAIFQDFVRYQLPVKENIGFGAVELIDDQTALKAAAELAGVDELIETLPAGWDTVLSRQYTDGTDLSGGQWQRVALARAMMAARARPGLLVLDEPTANLDVRAEAEIYDRFLELTRGLTTIVISHRFSTVRQADSIAVLEHGRVIEQGTHDELLSAGGRYAQMFLLQASRFAVASEES